LNLVRAAIAPMSERGGGSIVLTSSNAGVTALQGEVAYSVSEAAEEDVASAHRTGSFESWLPGQISGIESVAGPRPIR
jgi:NADP-dependent 3-hydroxy acid dehydrogenase YdfG